MHVTFDTETTGIAEKGVNWEIDYMEFPHIVEISWKRSDREEVITNIIKPEGYTIPAEATEIHGISTEVALEKGEYFDDVITAFIDDCLDAKLIIGHNIYFDTSNIKANVLRSIEKGRMASEFKELVIAALDKSKRIDTMYKTIAFCNIPFPNGRGRKWPKLSELYAKLFEEEFNEHNSKDDVLATERCFLKLQELNIL